MATEEMNKRKELVGKILSGEAGSADMQELAEWSLMDRRMRAQWDNCGRMPADAEVGQRMRHRIEQKIHGTAAGKRPVRMRLNMMWMLAAACVVALVVVAAFWLRADVERLDTPQFVEVLAQADRKVLLPDGSQVWMKPGSRLCYRDEFMDDRRVWLEGEAVFEVQKRTGSYFKVFLDSDFIEVKGTVFRAVNRRQLPHTVDLFEGKVEFNAVAAKRKIVMKPHQHLKYTPGDDVLELEEVGPVEWDNGRYRFRGIRTYELARTIGHIFNVWIVLDDDAASKELFNGTIRADESLQEVLDKLCYNLGLNCKYESGCYRLFRQDRDDFMTAGDEVK